MPIDSQHPDFKRHIDTWQKCRDVYQGEDAVRLGGQKYLRPIDPSQNHADYRAYAAGARLHDAYARTVTGCTGTIARREHVVDLPEKMECFIADVTASGIGFGEFVKHLAGETLITGRSGLLVDFDEDAGRSCIIPYPAESIINWGEIGLVLHESVFEPDPKDQFETKAVEQWRHLHILDGVYTVSVWRRRDSAVFGSEMVLYDERVPRMRTGTLSEIPWVWLSYSGRTNAIVRPPLLGLADAALNYWTASAELQWGRHWTAMPTLVVSGHKSEEPLRVGGSAALILSDPASKVFYAEFTGQGLGSLERGLQEIVDQLALLGASAFGRMPVAETAEAARIRSAGESSILSAVVDAVEDSLTAALRIAARWMSAQGEPVVKLNREFFPTPIDPQLLSALVAALQAGALTSETFAYALQQHEMLPPVAPPNSLPPAKALA